MLTFLADTGRIMEIAGTESALITFSVRGGKGEFAVKIINIY